MVTLRKTRSASMQSAEFKRETHVQRWEEQAYFDNVVSSGRFRIEGRPCDGQRPGQARQTYKMA
jgi:hypothetical protein